MCESVGVDAICAQMLKHLAHHALAGGDIAGETYDVFAPGQRLNANFSLDSPRG